MAAPGAGVDFAAVAAALEDPLCSTNDALAACHRILLLGEHFKLPRAAKARLLKAIAGRRGTERDKLLLERFADCERAVQGAAATPATAPPVAGGGPEVATSSLDSDDAGRKLACLYDSFAAPLPAASAAAPAVVAACPVPAAPIPAAPAPAAVAAAGSPSPGMALAPLGDGQGRAGGASAGAMSLAPLGGAPAAAPAPRLPGAPEWQPGENVRGFIGRGRGGYGALQAQTRVVLANAHIRLARIPAAQRAPFRKLLGPQAVRGKTFVRPDFASIILSALTRIPALTLKNTVRDVLKNGPGARGAPPERRKGRRAPAAAAGAAPSAAAAGGAPAVEVRTAAGPAACPPGEARPPAKFLAAVRATGFLAARAMPRTALPHLMHLLLECHADVAAYASPQFTRVFDRTAYGIAARSRAQYLSQLLPATGTPVDFELFGDHFTVGQYFGRAGGTALVLGVNFPAPAPHYTAALPVAVEAEQADGRGPAQLEHLRAGFRRVDPRWDLADLIWRRVATATGDGALAQGGPAARHTGTGLMNALWKLPSPRAAAPARADAARARGEDAPAGAPAQAAAARAREEEAEQPLRSLASPAVVTPPAAPIDRARWDDFHRYSNGGARAMKASAMCQEFFRVLKALEAKFALGHGRSIDRAVSTFLEEKPLRIAAMCGHRKLGFFGNALTRYLDKFRAVYMALAVAQLHAMEGHLCFSMTLCFTQLLRIC